MNEELEVELSNYGKYRLIRMSNGVLSLYNCSEIRDVFEIGNKEKIYDWVLDLVNIEHIDSSALSVLTNQSIYINKEASRRIKLLSPKKGVKHLLEYGGFQNLFDIISDLSELD